MSRTRRRKSVIPDSDWAVHSYIDHCLLKVRWQRCLPYEITSVDDGDFESYKNWKFHSDTRSNYGWSGNAPADYRRSVTREQRAKDKMVTRSIMKSGNYEEYGYNPWKKDAGYNYW
jgi:hypothetical protein